MAGVAFPQADMTTYRRADGELIGGDYKFVEDMEYVDDEAESGDGPLDVVEERWVRLSARTLRIYPLGMLCDQCGDEDEDCDWCQGRGIDPFSGRTIEVVR